MRLVLGDWERTEVMVEATQVATEGPTRGERVEQMMRAILIRGCAMVFGGVMMIGGGL